MSTLICGKRRRSQSPETESIAKRINTLHIGSPPPPLAGVKRKLNDDQTLQEYYPIVNTLPVKRRRDTLEVIDESGPSVRETYTCDKQGRKQGKYESWYHDGQRCELSHYIDGREEGTIQHWYQNGKPYSIYTIRFGLKEGVSYTWFQNGMIKTIEPYMSGLIHGTVTHFCENGNKIHESIYELGEFKKETFWSTDGNIVYKDI